MRSTIIRHAPFQGTQKKWYRKGRQWLFFLSIPFFLSTSKASQKAHHHSRWEVALSNNGGILASVSHDCIQFFDIGSGERLSSCIRVSFRRRPKIVLNENGLFFAYFDLDKRQIGMYSLDAERGWFLLDTCSTYGEDVVFTFDHRNNLLWYEVNKKQTKLHLFKYHIEQRKKYLTVSSYGLDMRLIALSPFEHLILQKGDFTYSYLRIEGRYEKKWLASISLRAPIQSDIYFFTELNGIAVSSRKDVQGETGIFPMVSKVKMRNLLQYFPDHKKVVALAPGPKEGVFVLLLRTHIIVLWDIYKELEVAPRYEMKDKTTPFRLIGCKQGSAFLLGNKDILYAFTYKQFKHLIHETLMARQELSLWKKKHSIYIAQYAAEEKYTLPLCLWKREGYRKHHIDHTLSGMSKQCTCCMLM